MVALWSNFSNLLRYRTKNENKCQNHEGPITSIESAYL